MNDTTISNIQIEIFEFVKECARTLDLMQGIETSSESLKSITDYLVKNNPGVLESKETILKMLPYGNFTYKKQLTIEDFTITQQKLSKMKELGEKWYNQSQINFLIQEYESQKIKELLEYIESLKNEIRKWEFKWKEHPEAEIKKGWGEFKKIFHEMMDKDLKSDEIIRFLVRDLKNADLFIKNIKNKFRELRNEPEKLMKILSNLLETE